MMQQNAPYQSQLTGTPTPHLGLGQQPIPHHSQVLPAQTQIAQYGSYDYGAGGGGGGYGSSGYGKGYGKGGKKGKKGDKGAGADTQATTYTPPDKWGYYEE